MPENKYVYLDIKEQQLQRTSFFGIIPIAQASRFWGHGTFTAEEGLVQGKAISRIQQGLGLILSNYLGGV